jgi:hypothetical protein
MYSNILQDHCGMLSELQSPPLRYPDARRHLWKELHSALPFSTPFNTSLSFL